MGETNTSVAALNAITATQFTELSTLGLADAKAERGQGEKRGALITFCLKHGINTANHSGSGAKRSLSSEQVKLFKADTLIHRLSDQAQALYLMGGKQAAGAVAPDTDGSTYTEKGVKKDFRFYDQRLNTVLKDIQNGIEGRKVKAERVAGGGNGTRDLVTFIIDEGSKMFKRSYKDENIDLPEGNEVPELQGMIKDLLIYVGGKVPVIKD
jgi:hypothetical protein